MNAKELQNKNFGFKPYRKFIKPTCDRIASAITLLVLSPVILIIAIAIYSNMGHPIFFCQRRPGKNGRIFTFYKFRTMTNDKNRDGALLTDERRLTPLGKLLRQTSLDELPQLWNVLKGDMSFVGPRPLLVQYLERYSPEQARRHEVTPGITGWAQVNGRNTIPWEERFALDVWYVDHQSLQLDLWIMVLTIWKILKREGINHPEAATMFEFKGNR
ncbi:sugar transferase [Aetokthonos hydrillicola Thurmond2011]|jgi:lipopolysaccharide/colanic/teichoic acid biosynthesis glycosyltransferase|uniref:Sugar transferase n=1 Tax=Aetokthonos hydrillicola Thurmond2011 TaxID=2712845 RepID=A0AAP5MAM4_9CYAN|nr:sugar transferase [Aetokthonos hydrillicola]MDR9896043.1 sugar transferase [Aetokthonos hydrillicola Thurmond2011]